VLTFNFTQNQSDGQNFICLKSAAMTYNCTHKCQDFE